MGPGTEEQLVANSNTWVSDSPGSGDIAFRVERATAPRGSGAEVVVSLRSRILGVVLSVKPRIERECDWVGRVLVEGDITN